jgi:hypothetical protein
MPRHEFALTMDLTPAFMSRYALRKVAKSRWPSIRRSLLRERGPVCEICKFTAEEPRYIDAHEVFQYPANGAVRLVRIQLLCKRCHDCKHFDHLVRLEAEGIREGGRAGVVIDHFCRVNICTKKKFYDHLTESLRYKRKLELRYSSSLLIDHVHYGPYHERVVETWQRRTQREEEAEDDWDSQFWEPLPDHEFTYTPEGELYGHREPRG